MSDENKRGVSKAEYERAKQLMATYEGFAEQSASNSNFGSWNEHEGNTTHSQEQEMIETAMNFARHSEDGSFVPSQASRLRQPIAIPQVRPVLGGPICRAYAEVLNSYNISAQELVGFIDNFNILLTGSPPLTAIDIASQGVQFVPSSWAQLASAVAGLGVGLTKFALIKTRCHKFVQKSNAEFFEPRGLKLQIKKTSELAQICGIRVQDIQVQPMERGQDLSALGGPLDRRLKALSGHTAPLTFDVPPPAEPSNVLAKISAKQSAATEKKLNKKNMKDREKAMEKAGIGGESGQSVKEKKEMTKIDEQVEKIRRKADKNIQKAQKEAKESKRKEEVRKAEKDLEKELKKIEEERGKVRKDVQQDAGKDYEDFAKDEEKAIKESKKGMWMIIRNKDEVEAEELQDQKRKANSPFAFWKRSK